jgi:hypothetical protein
VAQAYDDARDSFLPGLREADHLAG